MLEVRHLRPDWGSIWANTVSVQPGATLFHQAEWLNVFQRTQDLELVPLAITQNDRVVGVLPQASILFDKFHIVRHMDKALDLVPKSKYARVSGRQRRSSNGTATPARPTRGSQPQPPVGLQELAHRQPVAAHPLAPQDVVRASLGLRSQGLGAGLLRELAGRPRMAAFAALRKVRSHD